MAKVQYADSFQFGDLKSSFGPHSSFVLKVDGNGKSASFRDSADSANVTMLGSGMEEGTGGKENHFVSGTVNKLTFSSFGDTYATVTGKYDAEDLSDANAKGGPFAVIEFLFAGQDTFVGSSQGDYLNGFGGDGDRLTGKAGSDFFILSKGNKADIVTDFDFKGNDHDWIQIDANAHARISVQHGDVVVTVGHDSLTLDGISRKDFDEDWIIEAPHISGRADLDL